MPTGTGAERLNFLPAVPYIMDPGLFMTMTETGVGTVVSPNPVDPAAGNFWQLKVPEVGVVSRLRITYRGTLDVVTAAVTTGHDWPYGLLKKFILSANGQNDLWNCDGPDLHALRFLRYPAFDDVVDDFPGTVGGGDSVGVATHDLDLSWHVPIAIDDVTLIGSLFAQSPQTNLQVRGQRALNDDLFSANAANATITGEWAVEIEHWEIPIDAEGNLVLPDLTRLHGFNATDFPFTNTGGVRTPLIRSAGQLVRLLVSAERDVNARLSALPSAADADTIDAFRLEYGGNQRPFDFDPAANLLRKNNEHYGGVAPYDRLVLDFIKENPTRDALFLQGVTELNVVPVVNSAVTVTDGQVRVAQETLF